MVDNTVTSGVIHSGISDHSLICAVRKFAVPKTRRAFKEVRSFKHFVEVAFINDLSIGSRGKMLNVLMPLT